MLKPCWQVPIYGLAWWLEGIACRHFFVSFFKTIPDRI